MTGGREHGQERLTLELGAYSPSETQHTFRDFHLEPDYPYQEKKDLETHFEAYKLQAKRLGLANLNDPYHGWVNGQRTSISLEAKQRIIGTLTLKLNHSNFPENFPKVEIVTGLFIRRQFYRKIAAKSLCKLLCEAFTCVRWFRHEGWHGVDQVRQSRFDYGTLNSPFLPTIVLREQLHVNSNLTNLRCRLQEPSFEGATDYSSEILHI